MTLSTKWQWVLSIIVLILCGVGVYLFMGGKLSGAGALGITEENKDTIPPTIVALPIEVELGQQPDYRKDVKVTTPYGNKFTLTVDSAQVQLNRPGVYQVSYIATDTLGNTAVKQVDLQVYDPHHRVIYLTFDDGPSKNTPKILEILRNEGVKATFFVTAQFSEYLPYLKKEAEEGHAVAAHTYSHDFNIYKSVDSYMADLEKIEAVIEQYTGKRSYLIRFPGGSSNYVSYKRAGRIIMPEIIDELQKRGYQYVDWNLDSQDASGNHVPVAKLVSSACRDYEPRLCLLMHDEVSKATTVEALPQIIHYFKEKGYEFGTLNTTAYYCHQKVAKEEDILRSIERKKKGKKN